MMTIRSQFKGGAELARKLKKLSDGMAGDYLRQSAHESMTPVKHAAKINIPEHDTGLKHAYDYLGFPIYPGFARDNIIIESRLNRNKDFAWARVGVRHRAYYATAFVELGTVYQDAQPWLEPAFRANRTVVIKMLGDRLEHRLKQLVKPTLAPPINNFNVSFPDIPYGYGGVES